MSQVLQEASVMCQQGLNWMERIHFQSSQLQNRMKDSLTHGLYFPPFKASVSANSLFSILSSPLVIRDSRLYSSPHKESTWMTRRAFWAKVAKSQEETCTLSLFLSLSLYIPKSARAWYCTPFLHFLATAKANREGLEKGCRCG